jgi:acetylornithine deacetylase
MASETVSSANRRIISTWVGEIERHGVGEIRTHEARGGLPVFKTGAIDRSATTPRRVKLWPMTDPVDLTRALLAIPSPTGHEHAVTAYVAAELCRLGWTVVLQPVRDGRENVYAHRGNPLLVFSTHLDTVPPELPYREDDLAIHGRGACDAKGIAAAMIAAAEQLVAEGEDRIGLLFVVDEEDGSAGAQVAATLEPRGSYLINGEPTDNRLVTAQKGTLKIIVEAHGRAAHSGYPELGDSAIDRLLEVLQRLREVPLPVDPELGPSTLNIGRIAGGEAPNVVAPYARAELLVRLVGDDSSTRAAMIAAAGSGVALTFVPGLPAARAPSLPGWPSTAVAFASDMAIHGAWGICYQLGPGSIHVAHTPGEYINKAELREGVRLYVKLAKELLDRSLS